MNDAMIPTTAHTHLDEDTVETITEQASLTEPPSTIPTVKEVEGTTESTDSPPLPMVPELDNLLIDDAKIEEDDTEAATEEAAMMRTAPLLDQAGHVVLAAGVVTAPPGFGFEPDLDVDDDQCVVLVDFHGDPSIPVSRGLFRSTSRSQTSKPVRQEEVEVHAEIEDRQISH